jgi:2-oxo-3-hexenedioate decarboxylase
MGSDEIHEAVQLLNEALISGTPVSSSSSFPPLDLSEAYTVQGKLIELREARGEKLVGAKLGFTSAAKMIQMGVDSIIAGRLTDKKRVLDGGTLDDPALIHPRVEPEVAFRLGRDVDPTDPTEDILDAIDAVAPALEVIDSRYAGFAFDLPRVVADNTSAVAFTIGQWTPITGDVISLLANTAVTLTLDGHPAAFGSTADILGNPLRVLADLKAMAAEHGIALRKGFVILAGAATAAVELSPGVVAEARVAGLGRAAFTRKASA